ncbi:hypothetical protein LOTGIDRAFT_158645 [Lottia gigantea]|uniref:Uncharacterized protein n=1 Tax=Lottia gigantea TaxID=225164 RepID=V4A6J9_LOTGI|nr:hypothetical protein LOTGIDRAFT_158645 [Lottia gigantea]ESO99553.1 hypothetical protein LOTGIDRAFT_158645 [Lottia gigantea]
MCQELLKVARPENCTALVTVLCNIEIWSVLSSQPKTLDKKLQNIETLLVKAASILTKAVHKQGQAQEASVLEIDRSMEVLALMGQCNRQLNFFRRELMKVRDLHTEFSHLCSHSNKFNQILFGDDIPKKVKEIGDCKRFFFDKISGGFGGNSSFNKSNYVRPHVSSSKGRGRSFVPGRTYYGNRGGARSSGTNRTDSKNFKKGPARPKERQ